jgi:hypothetical protein
MVVRSTPAKIEKTRAGGRVEDYIGRFWEEDARIVR